MKRSGFKRPTIERKRTVHTPIPEHLRRGRMSPVGLAVAAVVKPQAHRNRALLDMAQNRPCLLLVPDVHRHSPDTTVACHSNRSEHGKAGARKADDHWSVWGCYHCHSWLDASDASAQEKQQAFDRAMLDQLHWWGRIADDPSEPDRFRRAARWALQLHGLPV